MVRGHNISSKGRHNATTSERSPLLANSWTHQCAGSDSPCHRMSHNRPPGSGVQGARLRGAGGNQGDFPDETAGDHLSRFRNGCVGSRAGQLALTRRSGADVRHRTLRQHMAQAGWETGPRHTAAARKLAGRSQAGGNRTGVDGRQKPRHQSRLCGPQRHRHRHHLRHPCNPQGHRPSKTSRTFPRGHDFLIGFHGFPARRVGS